MTPPHQPSEPTTTYGAAAAATNCAAREPVVPLTGAQYPLTAGDYDAVVTGLGAGLRELSYRGHPLIAGYRADELPPAGAGQLLAPWPNRVADGRYGFDGATYQLDLNEPDRRNAIHGLTRWDAWTPLRQQGDLLVLRHEPHGRPGYPFCVAVDAEYRLVADAGLLVSVTATNRGDRAAPYGTGQHPYLTAGAPSIDECELRVPAARWLPVDDRGIPSGPERAVAGTPLDFLAARPVGGTRLDHAFADLVRERDGRAWARLRCQHGAVALWAGAGYRWLQVFTGDPLAEPRRRKAVAVEPMTCPPNAFATGQDLLVLQPGDSVTHTWGVVAEPA